MSVLGGSCKEPLSSPQSRDCCTWACFFRGPTFTNGNTLPKTNIAPENGWLEDLLVSFSMAYFQVRAVSFREGRTLIEMGVS